MYIHILLNKNKLKSGMKSNIMLYLGPNLIILTFVNNLLLFFYTRNCTFKFIFDQLYIIIFPQLLIVQEDDDILQQYHKIFTTIKNNQHDKYRIALLFQYLRKTNKTNYMMNFIIISLGNVHRKLRITMSLSPCSSSIRIHTVLAHDY